MDRFNFLNHLTANPKRVFLIDALGAFVSTIFLFGVLAQLQHYVGMPIDTLYLLAGIAFCLFIFSMSCYNFIKSNWKPFLKLIILFNSFYFLLSLELIFKHYEELKLFGLAYFVLELIVLLGVIVLEFKTYLKA